jgi:ABC-type cobalamin/Fe3+-siderophores transport system ATPase subunit
MQLKRFDLDGLFNGRPHAIDFPVPSEDRTDPSVVILYGRNGVGKTTILRMLDGLLRLDFNVFRQIPFNRCSLEFDSTDRVEVTAVKKGQLSHLLVTFNKHQVQLHPEHHGALVEADKPKVEEFRAEFLESTEKLSYEFIDTKRLELQRAQDESDEYVRLNQPGMSRTIVRRPPLSNPKARFQELPQSLATRVKRFIRDAQVNYRTFFSTTEPELFPRMIERLTAEQQSFYDIPMLRDRFTVVHERDTMNERFGLEPDRWDYGQMMSVLENLSKQKGSQHAVTVVGAYIEQLESRSAERALVADRLRTFERLMTEFFGDKTVAIDARHGFLIKSHSGDLLEEGQLSSGEFHLLLLMVAALVTRRRGTVIAIDEPEMSMHIAWQRKLVPALVECASKANPLFIFATHSPDLAASFSQAMVGLE